MIDGLAALKADVILLQEVFAQSPTGLHVGQRLATALAMDMHFVPARQKLRTLNGSPILCHSGLAVLSKTPIHDGHAVRLPMDERDGERIGQRVSLTLRGIDVCVGNMHLTHLTDAHALRRKQLQAMLKACGERADLTVLGGDMNAPQGHALFKVLEGFVPLDHSDVEPASSLNPVADTSPPPGIIDHLFIRRNQGGDVSAKAHLALHEGDARTGRYPSDHKAVVANLSLS
jgi:endonuclease/exonuclease/phosphatase family metal-dependent hydrolase